MNNQRKKFEISRKVAYLNCANMSPLMKKVANAGKKGIAKKFKPYNLTGDDYFNDPHTAKKLFAQLINCPDWKRIATVGSAAYGIAAAAKNVPLKKGEKILVTDEQFPSNYYVWKQLAKEKEAEIVVAAAPDTTERRGEKWNEIILNSIDSQTKVVTMGQVHWADGTLFDLVKVREKCDEVGAALIVDGTQTVGAYPFDVQQIRPDALIVPAYKWLMGPYSIGLAYYGEMFDNGQPLEYPWVTAKDADKFSMGMEYVDGFRPGSLRYDMGQMSNFILNPMLIQSLKQVNQWTTNFIQTHCSDITHEPILRLKELGMYIEDEDSRGHHIFGVKYPEGTLDQLQKALKKHRVFVSFRGKFVRVAPHVYNDTRDMNKLIRAFEEVYS
ncbi:aminotransferase class V-fold PLP-dependent enzyme [Reichenbachiella versicolor]|uniref:aminotransferase class V-fold PLP-dependent enzyme n=1 Tax=Reichenbachiella versicolor TaxID=1821036 RepID=UPI000D6E724F|nr:aminotransferase class V-fold PLP-dependent enzyme [Reichenbachiella versicolor]